MPLPAQAGFYNDAPPGFVIVGMRWDAARVSRDQESAFETI